MRKIKKKLQMMIHSAHYFLLCLELGMWKIWADLTCLTKHRKMPRKHTPEDLAEASRLIRTWMERDRKKESGSKEKDKL